MFRNKKNLANIITFSRILGVGYIFYLTPYATEQALITVVLVYTFICLTDFLDGWVARKYNIVSDLGKVLDPLADKILVLVFLPLLSMHAISAFPVFLVLAREFAIMGLRVFSAKQGLIIAANFSGKLKTAITFPVCGILMARVPVSTSPDLPLILKPVSLLREWVYSWPSYVFEALIWAMVLVTIWSFLDYMGKFLWQRALSKHNQDQEKAKKEVLVWIPNSVSFINLMCGIFASFHALSNQLQIAGALVLIGVILDAMDGKIARKLGVYSKLGEKLDSKADIITFGVAPSIIIAQFFGFSPYPYGLLGLAYFIAVYYRLRRFDKSGHSDYFEGLPCPAGASYILFAFFASITQNTEFLVSFTVIIIYLTISKVPYAHNSVSSQKYLLQHLRKPSLIVWFLSILQLLGVPFPSDWHIIDAIFILTGFYLFSPLIPLKKEFRQS